LQQKLTTNQPESQQYLKSQLVREIDFSWANYLESLEKVRFLVHVRQWLPQDPQEAFFWETSELFQVTRRHIHKKMRQILLNSLPKSSAS
jgi:preprotein translocase subunit SecA